MTDIIINKLIQAAENHGKDGNPQHQVGDLEGMLRLCWSMLSVQAQHDLLAKDEVQVIIEAGARNEFNAKDLSLILSNDIFENFTRLKAEGYDFIENDYGHKWVKESPLRGEDADSVEFEHVGDAVRDADKDFQRNQVKSRMQPRG